MWALTADKIDKKTSRSLKFLSLAFFIQATTALSVVGALDEISAEWKLTATASALLNTAFGVTFAVTAPLLQMLFGHWPRKTQILSGLSVMALGTLIFAVAGSYELLFFARIVMGLGAALISPVLSALGSKLVPPHHQGAALAIVIMGYSIATVIGVPISAWIAIHAGPRWLYAGLGFFIMSVAFLIASNVKDRSPGEKANPALMAQLLRSPAKFGALMVVYFVAAGIFTTYTMITPILKEIYSAGPSMVSTTLLIFGISGLTGNLFVRWASENYSSERLLGVSLLSLAAVFAVLLIAPSYLLLFLAAIVAWPFIADVIWPSQQRRIVELEPDFRGMALALNASFMFAGIATGSALGGVFYPRLGFDAILAISIGLIVAGLSFLKYSMNATHNEIDVLETQGENQYAK